jgi:hypothetical protein
MNDKVKNNAKKEIKNGEVITENESDITENITDENAYNVEAFVAVDAAKEIVEDIDSHFKTLLVGHAPKLSSKSQGLIGYEVALNTDDKSRYLRLTSNDSGGLFSKEWVKLDDLYELLEAMEADK